MLKYRISILFLSLFLHPLVEIGQRKSSLRTQGDTDVQRRNFNGVSHPSKVEFDGIRRQKQGTCPVLGWRRRRDLNPRAGFIQPTPLAGEPLRPLGYFCVFQDLFSFPNKRNSGGESGIRTHGRYSRRRFSRPVPSTTRTSLHRSPRLLNESYLTTPFPACQPFFQFFLS